MTNKNDKTPKNSNSFDAAFDNISADKDVQQVNHSETNQSISIDNLSNTELAQLFSSLGRENNSAVVIPIGFPAAGKSMWLSSLFWYASSGGAPFSIDPISHSIYAKGDDKRQEMVTKFSNQGDLIPVNIKGTLDLIRLQLDPNKPKIPNLDLTLLDLAGEDISRIEKSNGREFTDKIETVFNGLQVNNSRVIFVLLTPFKPARLDTDSRVSDLEGHNREDKLHVTFLQYLSQKQPNLYANSKVFMIVSQWDTNSDPALRVEDYIRINRPQVFNYIQNKDVIYGEYSIGRVLTQNERDGTISQSIAYRDENYPYRFWKEMYVQITGHDLDKKPWWQRLFS